MDDVKTFVALKYKILTSDRGTWHLCETYPKEVRSAWAWRCAADVEHLAKGNKESEYLIEVAKKYRDGMAGRKELVDASCANSFTNTPLRQSAVHAARVSTCACQSTDGTLAAEWTIHAVNYAVNAAFLQPGQYAAGCYADKWDLYISWLIEELAKWELTHG